MWSTLSLPEFWFGALILLTYQIAKFSELNSLSPSLATIPNLRADDFTGRLSFFTTLAAFLVATFFTYLLLCLLSPNIISSWAKLTGEPDVAAYIDSVPYPLYIAAAFLGLTQPAIPGLSRIGNLQRDFFHFWIGVPKTVVSTADYFSNQILARQKTNEDLGKIVQMLAGREWIALIDPYADAVFYKEQIGRLKLNEKSDLDEVLAGSKRELTSLIEQLICAASLATVRESGGRALHHLAHDLHVSMPSNGTSVRSSIGTALLFFVGLTFLWALLPLLHPVSERLLGSSAMWPDEPATSGQYLLSQVAPVILSVGITLMWLNTHRAPPTTAGAKGAAAQFYRYSPLFIIVTAVIVAFDWLQTLYDYGYFHGNIDRGPLSFFLVWLPYYILHATISVVTCYAVAIHVNNVRLTAGGGDMQLKWGMLLSVVAFLSALYAGARWQWQLAALVGEGVSGLHFVVLIVMLNLAAATLAFSVAMSFRSRRVHEMQERSHIGSQGRMAAQAALGQPAS